MAQEESIYGAGVVTGSKEEARTVDVQISSTETTQLNVGATSTENVEAKPAQDNQTTPETTPVTAPTVEDTPEQALAKEITTFTTAQNDVAADLKTKGVEWDGLAKEFGETGALSEETLAKLTEAGYPKSAVEAYIAGLYAVSEKLQKHVYDLAGGQKQFEQVQSTIKAMGPDYVNAFNEAIDKGNLKQIELIISGAKAHIDDKFGTANETILGSAVTAQAPTGFTSRDEMVKAMSDRRYGRDKAYTDQVRTKTANASFW